jgi:cytochrome P450
MTSIPEQIATTLLDPRSYADMPQVHTAYRWLRKHQPLGVVELPDFDPFWMVTKHADILEISRQNQLFHNGVRGTVLSDKATDAMVRHMRNGSPHLVRTLVHMDEPDHRNYRALTNHWFTPSNVLELTREFVDRMLAHGGECDFVKDVALYYPLRVIMQILGVPQSDEPRMLKLTQELFGARDPDLNRSGNEEGTQAEFLDALNVAVVDFFQYFGAITQDRRANPRDDASSLIANGMINGEPISEFEAMSYYVIIATAGHDTTSASTAAAMAALCEQPEVLQQVQANPALIPSFIEEAVRWASPVRHFMRTAMVDYELRGQKIRAGDWLHLSYVSGNRDEAVFEDPDTFRANRQPNKQLAFGYGGHMCLGQHLARLEMKILYEELLPRIKSVELAGTPSYSKANFVGGLKSLPIRFVAA